MTRSCSVLGQGREDLREWAKERSLGTVRVVTDDAEISLAYLLRKNGQGVTVCTCQQERMYDRFQFGHRQRWVTLLIPWRRITEVIYL